MCVIKETMSGFICAVCDPDCECVVCSTNQAPREVMAEEIRWSEDDAPGWTRNVVIRRA